MSVTTNSPSKDNKKVVFIFLFSLALLSAGSYWVLSKFIFGKNYSNIDIATQRANFKVAPNIEFKDFTGKMHALSSFKGKVIILNFWASWCAPCLEEIPSMVELSKKYPNEVVIIALSGDDSFEAPQKTIAQFDTNQENFLTSWDMGFKVAKTFQVKKIPESFIIKKDLSLHRKIEGSIDWMSPFSQKEIESLIKN